MLKRTSEAGQVAVLPGSRSAGDAASPCVPSQSCYELGTKNGTRCDCLLEDVVVLDSCDRAC